MMLLGMAVEFGWSWWVFTTIAVVVAAACALLLRFVGSRLAQGILITLLVEGVVIAALAPVVMTRTHLNGSMKPATQPFTVQSGMGGSSKP
jgi:hypothetical protein